MDLINSFDGAVFFVDLLGMGALTQNQIIIQDEELSYWSSTKREIDNNQHLAALILAKFRKILLELQIKYTKLTISQLSDCAFIWSKNHKEVIKFLIEFMQRSISKGLLCRGGLATGNIIETKQSHKLGRFIVGQAVTKAVKPEGLSKGTRVLFDSEVPIKLWKEDEDFAGKVQPIFSCFENPLDFQTYDELKWYLVPKEYIGTKDMRLLSEEERINATKFRLKLACHLRFNPKFLWNTRSTQGIVQLKASTIFLTENKLLSVIHEYEWMEVEGKRDFSIVDNIIKKVDEFEEYRIIHKNQ